MEFITFIIGLFVIIYWFVISHLLDENKELRKKIDLFEAEKYDRAKLNQKLDYLIKQYNDRKTTT